MRKSIVIIFILLLPIISISQTRDLTKIVVRKSPCCDSLRLMFPATRVGGDSIIYSELTTLGGLWAFPKNCIEKYKTSIISFEITVNKEKKQFVKGNTYRFGALTRLKQGGELLISNCIVKCECNIGISVIDTILTRKITVLASE